MLTNAYQDSSQDSTRVVVLPKIEAVCPIIGLSIELQAHPSGDPRSVRWLPCPGCGVGVVILQLVCTPVKATSVTISMNFVASQPLWLSTHFPVTHLRSQVR